MRYRNGREAKNGDKIVMLGGYGTGPQTPIAIGVLYDARAGNDHCNGGLAPIQNTVQCPCLCDCLHVDDLAAILAEKGLDKRPESSWRGSAGVKQLGGRMNRLDSEGIDALPPVAESATDVNPSTLDQPDAEQESVAAELDRLQAIERCAERLWPAMRFFGLCGANPEYMAAVADLGVLLGKFSPPSAGNPAAAALPQDAINRVKRQAVQQLADAIAASGEVKSRVGRGNAAEIAEIVRGMQF